MYLFFGIFFLVLLIFFCLNHWRKKKIICKIRSMCMEEKCGLLNEIIAPFGYCYLPSQDIFASRIDAWQREFGYCALYDNSAVFFNMVFDCLPVYFDYCGRTWLIELWKGQYGINTGCEVGVYHADRILDESERKRTVFQCAGDEYLPEICLTFSSIPKRRRPGGGVIAKLCARHWWLAAFRMGCFTNPSNLCLRVSICLSTPEMAQSFVRGLLDAGCSRAGIQCHCCTVTFEFAKSGCLPKRGCFRRFVAWIVQWGNWFWCKVYMCVTRPFRLTVDRLLYLYFYLPFAFRNMLRLRRHKKHRRAL